MTLPYRTDRRSLRIFLSAERAPVIWRLKRTYCPQEPCAHSRERLTPQSTANRRSLSKQASSQSQCGPSFKSGGRRHNAKTRFPVRGRCIPGHLARMKRQGRAPPELPADRRRRYGLGRRELLRAATTCARARLRRFHHAADGDGHGLSAHAARHRGRAAGQPTATGWREPLARNFTSGIRISLTWKSRET